jgi:hypothetical protein
MKKFAVAILVFQTNGAFDLELVFVRANDYHEAWEKGMGKAHSLFSSYKYSTRMCTVKEVPEE